MTGRRIAAPPGGHTCALNCCLGTATTNYERFHLLDEINRTDDYIDNTIKKSQNMFKATHQWVKTHWRWTKVCPSNVLYIGQIISYWFNLN